MYPHIIRVAFFFVQREYAGRYTAAIAKTTYRRNNAVIMIIILCYNIVNAVCSVQQYNFMLKQ